MDIINNSISLDTIGGGLSALSRQFLTFGGVNESASAGSYTAVDGDVIEFDFATSSALGQYFFDESTGLNRLFCLKAAAATALTVPSGVTVEINGGGNSFTVDGKLHHVKLTIGPAAAGLVIDTYFKRFNDVEFFSGVVANIQFTGSDNRFYPMSGGRSGSGAYETDRLATLGATINSDISTWTAANATLSTVDGRVRVTNTGSGTGMIKTPVSLEAGKTYTFDCDTLAGTAANHQFSLHGSDTSDLTVGVIAGGPGFASFVYTETSTTTRYLAVGNRGGNVAGLYNDFSDPVLREAPNAMLLNNIVSTDWEKFTQVGADWLGGELVVNGGFDTDLTGWTSSNATVAGGKVTYTAAGFVFQDMASAINNPVLVAADAVGGTTPQLTVGISTNALGRFQHNGSLGDTLDNVSIKRILKAP